MNISYSSIVKKFDKKEKLIKYFFLIAIFACPACQSGNNETKKLVKKQVTIKVKIEDKEIIIKGEILQGRPEERLKKKIRI